MSGIPENTPEHLRPMLERFARGCIVCGAMSWRAMRGGGYRCLECGNVFDVPLVEEPGTDDKEGA